MVKLKKMVMLQIFQSKRLIQTFKKCLIKIKMLVIVIHNNPKIMPSLNQKKFNMKWKKLRRKKDLSNDLLTNFLHNQYLWGSKVWLILTRRVCWWTTILMNSRIQYGRTSLEVKYRYLRLSIPMALKRLQIKTLIRWDQSSSELTKATCIRAGKRVEDRRLMASRVIKKARGRFWKLGYADHPMSSCSSSIGWVMISSSWSWWRITPDLNSIRQFTWISSLTKTETELRSIVKNLIEWRQTSKSCRIHMPSTQPHLAQASKWEIWLMYSRLVKKYLRAKARWWKPV